MKTARILRRHQHEEQLGGLAVERLEIDSLRITAERADDLAGRPRILPCGIAIPSPIAVEPSRSRSASTAFRSASLISLFGGERLGQFIQNFGLGGAR